MEKFGTIVFYKRRLAPRNQRYRWRFRYANGKKGPNGGEGFSSLKDAERSAFELTGYGAFHEHRGAIELEFEVER